MFVSQYLLITFPNLEDQTSDTPVLTNLVDLVDTLHGFLLTHDCISVDNVAEAKGWPSNQAFYLLQVGVMQETPFCHFLQVILNCSSEAAKKLVERINNLLVTTQLISYTSWSKRLYAKHKRYLLPGTNVKVLRVLRPQDSDMIPNMVHISVPEKDKEIVELSLPFCRSGPESLTWKSGSCISSSCKAWRHT